MALQRTQARFERLIPIISDFLGAAEQPKFGALSGCSSLDMTA